VNDKSRPPPLPPARGDAAVPSRSLTDIEVALCRDLLRFDADTAHNLDHIRALLPDDLDAVIADFYAHLASFRAFDRWLADEATLARLKRAQRAYLASLGAMHDMADYADGRARIGAAHEAVGLDPRWYLVGVEVFFEEMAKRLLTRPELDKARTGRLLISLSKALWFDALLAIEAYHHSSVSQLEALVEQLRAAESRLREMSRIDDLTQVLNRHYLMEALNIEFARSVRYGHPFTVLFADLDRFKGINDTFGHGAGDSVLQHTAETLKRHTRLVDVVGRYGGEEFVIGLVQTDASSARVIAERIRVALAESILHHAGQRIPLSVSIGVTTLGPATPDLTALINAADGALYRAKALGRDRVWFADGALGA